MESKKWAEENIRKIIPDNIEIIYESNSTRAACLITSIDWNYRYKYTKTKSIKLALDENLVDVCYQDYLADKTIVLNFLFLVVLHEVAHLKYGSHSKRFARHWSNLAYKYYAKVMNTTTKEIRKIDKSGLYKWIKSETKRMNGE